MSLLERTWTARYHPLRAFFYARALYLLLSLDLWLEMVQHGGRYGLGEFNVAHFAFLDLVLPVPSSGLYVALLVVSGFVALTLALGPAPRWLRALLVLLYSLSWMLSLHDSYQHHYLLSWLLLWAAACPDPSLPALQTDTLIRGWAVPMTGITCSIVYAFTGIAKSEPEWRSGAVLRRITHSSAPGSAEPGSFDGARDVLLGLGLDNPTVWQLFALSTIALQWSIALGYLLAAHRDERPTRWRRTLVSLGLLSAISFHAIAELFHVFEIGLFSYYMLLIAVVLLGPLVVLRAWADLLLWLSSGLRGRPLSSTGSRLMRLGPALLSVVGVACVGLAIPLPGARVATVVLAILTLLRMAPCLLAERTTSGSLEVLALQTVVATLAMWLCLTQTSVPFDYYRRTAGELSRMGRLEQALSMYQLADRYAPPGESRAATIRTLQREIQQGSQSRRF